MFFCSRVSLHIPETSVWPQSLISEATDEDELVVDDVLNITSSFSSRPALNLRALAMSCSALIPSRCACSSKDLRLFLREVMVVVNSRERWAWWGFVRAAILFSVGRGELVTGEKPEVTSRSTTSNVGCILGLLQVHDERVVCSLLVDERKDSEWCCVEGKQGILFWAKLSSLQVGGLGC